MESMERISKKTGKDFLFRGTIPLIHEYSKCDYGQEPIEMATNIDIRQLYHGVEHSLFNFSATLNRFKGMLNEKGKDIINEDKHIIYDKYTPEKIKDKYNDITWLAHLVSKKKWDDFMSPEEKEIRKQYKEKYEGSWRLEGEAFKERKEELDALAAKRNELNAETEERFKRDVHKYWTEDWYKKNAWDFDEEERKELKNPYIKKEK